MKDVIEGDDEKTFVGNGKENVHRSDPEEKRRNLVLAAVRAAHPRVREGVKSEEPPGALLDNGSWQNDAMSTKTATML